MALFNLLPWAFILPHSGYNPTMPLQATPLDFEFRGYSIWLEISQEQGDLDSALDAAANSLDVDPIPAPHVTVIYGISHLSEAEILTNFREKLVPFLDSWPELRVAGWKVDKSFDGVDGQEMVRISWHYAKSRLYFNETH